MTHRNAMHLSIALLLALGGSACGGGGTTPGGGEDAAPLDVDASTSGGGSDAAAGDAGGCTPNTCEGLGIFCGSASDGCGGTLDCGPCGGEDTGAGGPQDTGEPDEDAAEAGLDADSQPDAAPEDGGGEEPDTPSPADAGETDPGGADTSPDATGSDAAASDEDVATTEDANPTVDTSAPDEDVAAGEDVLPPPSDAAPSDAAPSDAAPSDAAPSEDTAQPEDVSPAEDVAPTPDVTPAQDTGPVNDIVECTPTSCDVLGAECGVVGDGCGASQDCGGCAAGSGCESNKCVVQCQATTCEALGAECGLVGDGCGGGLDCGDCGDGDSCMLNVCVTDCEPATCVDVGAECGLVGDGCGGGLDCGACEGGETCQDNTCVTDCVPGSCESLGFACGVASNGCDGALNCGFCEAGFACESNECVEICQPTTCEAEGWECSQHADGCGGTLNCGGCDAGDSCLEGVCVPSATCDAGSVECAASGAGYHACGYDAASGTTASGGFVPCFPGQTCSGGTCDHSTCVRGEVMVLVDHSSSMVLFEFWDWVRDGLDAALTRWDDENLFGYRLFPTSGACDVGAYNPLGKDGMYDWAALPTPSEGASTPIEAALSGLDLAFGDPNDGEVVILISDGDETCGTQAGAVQAASALRFRGVETHVIAVGATANVPFLDSIAAVGGTGSAKIVVDQEALTTTLESIMTAAGFCGDCDWWHTSCAGDVLGGCEDGGTGKPFKLDCSPESAFCELLGEGSAACLLDDGEPCDQDAEPGLFQCAGDGVCFEGLCCTPDCTDKNCGDDGCGGVCGECTLPETCMAGVCGCVPQCEGKECGADACGGTCGTCPGAQDECVEGACTCTPTCAGKECGGDGCGGGPCGTCAEGEICTASQKCECVPDCSDTFCSDDGCGTPCGDCGSYVCTVADMCSPCQQPSDCSNPTTQVCDLETLSCKAGECTHDGQCSGNSICLGQVEDPTTGACYSSCIAGLDQCPNDMTCGPYSFASEGACRWAGPGKLGDPCEVNATSTSCGPGLACSGDPAVCVDLCPFWSGPANPCAAGTACFTFGMCLDDDDVVPVDLYDDCSFQEPNSWCGLNNGKASGLCVGGVCRKLCRVGTQFDCGFADDCLPTLSADVGVCTEPASSCGEQPDFSCQGKCGAGYDATAACQCDANCSQFSDCCPDLDYCCP